MFTMMNAANDLSVDLCRAVALNKDPLDPISNYVPKNMTILQDIFNILKSNSLNIMELLLNRIRILEKVKYFIFMVRIKNPPE